MQSTLVKSWIIFTAACSLFTLSQFFKTCIAVITPQLVADLSLDPEGLSLMSALFFYAFALTQIPTGIFLDRVGPIITMTLLSLISVLGVFLFAFSNGLVMSSAGRVLLGIGMACNLMGSYKLLTLWFSPSRFATLSTVIVSIGTMGTLASTSPLVMLVNFFGWRMVFTGLAVFTLTTTIIFYLIVRDKPHETPYGIKPHESLNDSSIFSGLNLLFRNRDYWIISIASFSRFGIFFAFQGLWAGPYLIDSLKFSALQAGNLMLAMNVGYILGGPVFGVLSDRIFKTRKWIVFPGLGLLSLIMFLMSFLPLWSKFFNIVFSIFFIWHYRKFRYGDVSSYQRTYAR